MSRKFLALARAEVLNRVNINDSLLECYIDPVYENGMDFSGDIVISGVVFDNVDEVTLSAILRDYIEKETQSAEMVLVEFRGDVVSDKRPMLRAV